MGKELKKFRKWDDDGDAGYESPRKKDRKREKQRGAGELWAEMEGIGSDVPQQSEERRYDNDRTERFAGERPQRPAGERKPIQMDPEFTVEIKGFKIDLSRLEDMKKSDSVYNGRSSYGIEFVFNSARGLGRTIWYGSNRRQRDEEFAVYEAKRAKAPKRR